MGNISARAEHILQGETGTMRAEKHLRSCGAYNYLLNGGPEIEETSPLVRSICHAINATAGTARNISARAEHIAIFSVANIIITLYIFLSYAIPIKNQWQSCD